MFEIADSQRTAAPYSSICYIVSQWADGTMTRASGVVVGINDVLTADHAVFDAQRGGYATRITITPGADTTPVFQTPFGSFSDVAVIYARTPDWDPSGDQQLYEWESQADLALLGLRTGIGAVTGYLPVSNYGGSFSGEMAGYPSRGTGLMAEQVNAIPSTSYGVFDIASSLGPGASGGPLLQTIAGVTSVVGVLSSGDLTQTRYAGLFGPGNWDWIQSAMVADNSVMGSGAPASGSLSGAASGVITYLGTGGSDKFAGTAANETYLGYGGLDTATFSGNRGQYFLSHSGSSVIVNDAMPGRDGGDTLASVEHAVFADMSVNLEIGLASRTISTGDLKLLEELYVGFFNRVPEADGLQFWIGRVQGGATVTQVADNFYDAALQYPALTGYSAAMQPAEFVDVVYRNVLGRTAGADAEGLAYWTAALSSGTQTHGSLVDAILQSAHTFKGDPTWGWVADLLDNKAAVAQHFAVDMGLNYNSPEASISHGMEIAAAVTASSTAAAVALIGVPDPFVTFG